MTAASLALTDQCHAHLFRLGHYVVPEIRPPDYTKVTTASLRILLGLVLIAYVAPVYFQVPVRVATGSLVLVIGLIGVYSLIHIVVSRRIVAFGSCLGAVVAFGLLVTLYVAGGSVLPILGHGKGQLAAATFLGVSLVVAGVRAAPGCELMAIPGIFFGKHTELACLIFSPLDKLERKLRSKRDV